MFNRKTILTLVVACSTLSASSALAKDKYDLSTRVQEANISCRSYIVATAKDPDSVNFPEDGFGVNLGFMMSRNHVYITNVVYGKNTYGAVLKHRIVCDAVCKQGQPCQIVESLDNN